jgi:hypothetical protein
MWLKDKGLCSEKHDTTAACRQGKVQQVHIKNKNLNIPKGYQKVRWIFFLINIWNFPFYVKNGNSYIIMLCIFLKGIFTKEFITKKNSKSDEKHASSPCTNNRNIHVCTLGPLA